MRSPTSQLIRTILTYLTLLVITLCAIYPLSAFITSGHPAFAGLDTSFQRWLGDISLVALAVAVTGLALASSIGYALSRSRFLRRNSTLGGALLAQLLPGAILLAPLCLVLVWRGLINSYLALLVIYLVTAGPFCIWQMKRNYDTILLAFEEAAQIDGASVWQSFVGLLLPLSVSALTMTLLFSFFVAWNEYVIGAIVYPKLFELQPAAQPAPYPAAALLISIPAILLFLLLSRLLIAAMHRGPVMD